MKTVLFIPGFRESPEGHAAVLEVIQKRGYPVRPVAVQWNDTTIGDWLSQARPIYEEHEPRDVILAGHSLGAITAFLLAAERNPSALWLLSLSARFAEDIPYVPARKLTYLGPKIVEAFEQIRFEAFAPKITCDTLLFFGSEERQKIPELVSRVKEAHRKIGTRSKLVEAIGAGHDTYHPAYLQAIARSI